LQPQTVSDVAVQAASVTWFAPQTVQGVHVALVVPLAEKVPAAQAAQAVLELVVHATVLLPGPQRPAAAVQDVHVASETEAA
jgi:hypothetical protein